MRPAALSAVLLFMVVGVAHAAVPAISPGRPGAGVAEHDEVSEPFFAFVFAMTARDSLGTWTAADVTAFGAGRRPASVFPLADVLTTLSREAVPAGEQRPVRGVTNRRRWVIELVVERVEMPMPFRFLGYRPGKLSCRGPLVLNEWQPGTRQLVLADDPDLPPQRWTVTDLTIYQIASGWLILDVHAWLDRLLGSALDDGASEGFAVGRVDGELLAIGNSTNRSGRRLFGELDLRTGKMDGGNRPVVLAMSRHCRHWTRPADFDVSALWKAYGR